MNSTAGYRTDIDYMHGYYRELAPGLLDFSLLIAGHEPPRRARLNYLELGYGQGLAANIHAAACPGAYWGNDFNPAHAREAQGMASASGAPAQFSDESFGELLARDDLPPMDQIVLHGIWSWIAEETQQELVELVRKRLRVGGVFYISYNSYPGWSSTLALRHLLNAHARRVGSDAQNPIGRAEAAIAFGSRLADAGASFFAAHPTAKARLASMAGQHRAYVAHEYFNDHSTPMYFSEVSERLARAKVSYACPAGLIDQIDLFNLTAPQLEILNAFEPGVMRETVRDYLQNQAFRRDLYTRGARRLTVPERLERLKAVRVALVSPPAEVLLTVQTTAGAMNLRKEVYRPILDALASAEGPMSIGDLAKQLKIADQPIDVVVEAVAVLASGGDVHPAQSDDDAAEAAPRTAGLNRYLLDRARFSGETLYLASPVIGGGVPVGRFQQLFLSARARGKKTPKDWAEDALATLTEQNQTIMMNGEALGSAQANLDHLTSLAKSMAETRLPILRKLKVVD